MSSLPFLRTLYSKHVPVSFNTLWPFMLFSIHSIHPLCRSALFLAVRKSTKGQRTHTWMHFIAGKMWSKKKKEKNEKSESQNLCRYKMVQAWKKRVQFSKNIFNVEKRFTIFVSMIFFLSGHLSSTFVDFILNGIAFFAFHFNFCCMCQFCCATENLMWKIVSGNNWNEYV